MQLVTFSIRSLIKGKNPEERKEQLDSQEAAGINLTVKPKHFSMSVKRWGVYQ